MSNLLVWCDTPVGSTGFSTVSKNVLKYLYEAKLFESIDILGINQLDSYYDQTIYPYKIYSPQVQLYGDLYGKERLKQLLKNGNYDYFLTINNISTTQELIPVISEIRQTKEFKWFAYMPLEQEYIKPSQLIGLNNIDKIILYHQDAYNIVAKKAPSLINKLIVIPHGTNTKDFFPLPEADRNFLRTKYFGCGPDDFLFLNVARNQWRKNLFVSTLAFLTYRVNNPDRKAKLYLHAARKDQGGNIDAQGESAAEIIKNQLGFDPYPFMKKDLRLTEPNFTGDVPIEIMNRIYNCADVLISTAYTEGWGLSATEAMACKVPVLLPDSTAMRYVVGNDERGTLIEVQKGLNSWKVPYGNSNIAVQDVDVDDLIVKMKFMQDNRHTEEIENKINKAYAWVQDNTWEKISSKWINLFNEH